MKSNLLTIILAIGFSWKITINSNTLKAEVQNKNNGASSTRDEKVLRQKAVAQGYELHNAQLDSQDKDKETFLYRVLVKDLATKEAHDFCSADQDGIAKAMLLKGSWDETGKHIRDRNVTVACTSGVLAKCVRWGYKPWTRVGGVSLRNYHQACTRMARADYCGNGTSHTKDGTLIDVYDRLKIQQPTIDSGLTFEAAWGVNGALILNHTRHPHTLNKLQQECPNRLRQIYSSDKKKLTYSEAEIQLPAASIFNNS